MCDETGQGVDSRTSLQLEETSFLGQGESKEHDQKGKVHIYWPINQYNQFRPFYTEHLYYETKGNKSYTAPSHFGKSGQFFWLRLLQPQAVSGLRVTVHHGARITLQCVLSPPIPAQY